MSYVATLIAPTLRKQQVDDAWYALEHAAGAKPEWNWRWLDEGEAADLVFERNDDPDVTPSVALREAVPDVDVIVQPVAHRRKRLLVADMDSTMITIECIDELADYAGIKPQIAEVTERSMRGELDFAQALEARVALLAGLDETAIERCHAERVRLMPGACALVRTMRAHGATCLLVSGGFTVFADRVATAIGFDRALSNVLEMAGGRLTGRVARPIVDAEAKRRALLEAATALGLDRAETLAVGDGANDIPMIEAAGLGVAYRAKPKTAAAADARIEQGDLHALLWAQGYARAEWIE